MQAGGIVDENLADEVGVVVDVAVEQLDLLGIVHHPLRPHGMRPVRGPDGAVDLDETTRS